MAKVLVEMSSSDLKQLVTTWFRERCQFDVAEEDVTIEVQSKQNFRMQEWEKGDFRARLEKVV